MKKVVLNSREVSFECREKSDGLEIILGESNFFFDQLSFEHDAISFRDNDGKRHRVKYSNDGRHLLVGGRSVAIETLEKKARKRSQAPAGAMVSPMPGKVLKVFVAQGERVKAGAPLLILEAMKMEHTIKASHEGLVEKVCFVEDDLVEGGVELVKIKAEKDE